MLVCWMLLAHRTLQVGIRFPVHTYPPPLSLMSVWDRGHSQQVLLSCSVEIANTHTHTHTPTHIHTQYVRAACALVAACFSMRQQRVCTHTQGHTPTPLHRREGMFTHTQKYTQDEGRGGGHSQRQFPDEGAHTDRDLSAQRKTHKHTHTFVCVTLCLCC
mgnify:CR=1 FL=1